MQLVVHMNSILLFTIILIYLTWIDKKKNGEKKRGNKSKNSIKSFHRKTTSSYFCGSYLSSNLEDDLINNINIDQYLEKNKKEEKKEKKNILVLNRDNNLDIFDI